MSLEDELRQHFKTEQPTIPGEGLGPEAIMRIGQEHRRSSRIRSTAAGFVVVSAAVLAVLALPNLGTDRRVDPADIVAGPDSSLAPDQGVSTEGPTRATVETQVVDAGGLTWTISEPTLGWARRFVADDTGFYALSTAPGTTWDNADAYPIPEAIYYSTDGITWEVRDLPEGVYAADFGASNGILYLLGTAPATSDPAGPVDVWLDTSTDLGATWSRQTAPSPSRAAPVGLGDYVWSNMSTSLAVSDSTTIATVSTAYSVDVYGLAPAEYQTGEFDIRQVDSGLEVYDMRALHELERACEDAWYHYELDTPTEDRQQNYTPEECKGVESAWNDPLNLVYSASWNELGIEDVGTLSYSDLFVSQNGGALVELESPFAADVQSLQLSATAAGFYATAWGPTPSGPDGWGSTLWTSPDGRSWDQAAAPGSAYEATPLGSFNNRLVALAYGESETRLVAFDNGAWTTIDFNAGLDPVADGSERWISQGGAGDGGVWLVAQTSALPDPATEASGNEYYEPGLTDLQLLFSDDLVNWSAIDIFEVLGDSVPVDDLWVNQIAVTNSSIYFSVNGYNPDTNESYLASVVGKK